VNTIHVASSDGVDIPVYDYAPGSTHGGVLFSHATGFHGRCFNSTASLLATSAHCYSFDYRGYGDATLPTDWNVTWGGYGDDAQRVAQHCARESGPLIAFGHSMGGAALVMAALREPELFRALVLFEPIIFPPIVRENGGGGGPSPLSQGARKRRATFASFDEAIANYSAKPPLNVFSSEVLNDYVRFGFNSNPDSTVSLKCQPEHEARTYESGALHETWDDLAKLRMPVWIVSGAMIPMSPAEFAKPLADAIPGSTFVQWNDLGHFGPMQDPQRIAQLISSISGSLHP
jgi:pimeloyl-ACP methyl ester carboxylesterase